MEYRDWFPAVEVHHQTNNFQLSITVSTKNYRSFIRDSHAQTVQANDQVKQSSKTLTLRQNGGYLWPILQANHKAVSAFYHRRCFETDVLKTLNYELRRRTQLRHYLYQ